VGEGGRQIIFHKKGVRKEDTNTNGVPKKPINKGS